MCWHAANVFELSFRLVNASANSRQDVARAGICAECVHSKRIESDRGSVFWRCGLSATDSRFAKYPALPVLRCPGFVPSPEKPNS
jgi:hypothetical protein